MPQPFSCQKEIFLPLPILKSICCEKTCHEDPMFTQILIPCEEGPLLVQHTFRKPSFSAIALLHKVSASALNLQSHFIKRFLFCILKFFMPKTPCSFVAGTVLHLTRLIPLFSLLPWHKIPFLACLFSSPLWMT